jgi:hypothetical protein
MVNYLHVCPTTYTFYHSSFSPQLITAVPPSYIFFPVLTSSNVRLLRACVQHNSSHCYQSGIIERLIRGVTVIATAIDKYTYFHARSRLLDQTKIETLFIFFIATATVAALPPPSQRRRRRNAAAATMTLPALRCRQRRCSIPPLSRDC